MPGMYDWLDQVEHPLGRRTGPVVLGEVRYMEGSPQEVEIVSDHPWEYLSVLWPLLARPTRRHINYIRTTLLQQEPWPEPEYEEPTYWLQEGSLSELFLEGGEYCG